MVVRLYDWMARRRLVCLLSLVVSTVLLLALVLRIDFKEDISDFLPLDSRQQQEMQVYQEVSGASRVFAVFSGASPDSLIASVDRFAEILEARDTAHWVSNLMAEADLSQAEQTTQFVYDNIPYFLEPADYQRMDSLLHAYDYIARQLQADREMLMFPAGGLLSQNIQRDPLNLFMPVVTSLQQTSDRQFELYEGHIFTPDMSRAIVMMDSSFGNSETDGNARLLALLQECADSVNLSISPSSVSIRVNPMPNLSITFTGGPVIAVGNARQIKADSVLSISLAVVLILLLLWFSFRRLRHLLLIAVAIGWGWLFALGALSLVHSQVSIIVIGISSVIIGIAVNYPLHLISHLSHTPDVRQALREIAKPLVVGNVTTVGAFLALVPLQSVALRDLGLFSSFLLVGTILFVLLWMPHALNQGDRSNHGPVPLILRRLSAVTLHDKPWLVGLVLVLTLFLGYHSLHTSFDTDLSHINYMTDEQRADMAALSSLAPSQPRTPFPTSGRLPVAFAPAPPNLARFLLSDSIQEVRLERWRGWVGEHRSAILDGLQAETVRAGFADDSFDDFARILATDYSRQPLVYFRQLPPNLLVQNIDVKGLNSSLLNSLSDNFNYIGWACGCIVFFFLWFSFRSLFLAGLSFLPMAVSWVWILGIMALCGIQFNIVNVILATFIFGQGDDYTIFMTEGAVYEYVHRRRMLASYKQAIILSALIMFIGIGSLIVARHPALHSLAEVTIVGMSSVVLMAFIFPPLIFSLYVRQRRKRKKVKK